MATSWRKPKQTWAVQRIIHPWAKRDRRVKGAFWPGSRPSEDQAAELPSPRGRSRLKRRPSGVAEFLRRQMRRGVFAVALIGVGFFLLTRLDFPFWVQPIERLLLEATGLYIKIDGAVGIAGPIFRPGIYAEDVSVIRLPRTWDDNDVRVAKIERAEVHINVWPLLLGEGYSEIDELSLAGAEIILTDGGEGPNSISALIESAQILTARVPEYYGELYLTGVMLRDAQIIIQDVAHKNRLSIHVEEVVFRSEGESLRVKWAGHGAYEPFVLDGLVAQPLAFIEGGSTAFDFVGAVGSTFLIGSGDVHDVENLDLDLSIQAIGPDLSGVGGALGMTHLPRRQPVLLFAEISGDLRRGFEGRAQITIGQGDADGSFSLNIRDKAHFEIYLESDRFDLAPFGLLRLLDGGDLDLETTTPFSLEWARKLEGIFSLRAARVSHGDTLIGAGEVMFTLTGGVMDFTLVQRFATGGLVSGSLLYDTLNDGALSLSVSAQSVELGLIGAERLPSRALDFNLDFAALVQTRGKSLAEFGHNLRGQTNMVAGAGTLGTWIADYLPAELTALVLPKQSNNKVLEMICFINRMDFEDGIAHSRSFFLETPELILTGTGTADLTTAQVDFTLWPRPKDPLALSEAKDLRVRGSLDRLSIEPITMDIRKGLSGALWGFANEDLGDEALPLISDHLPRDNMCLGPLLDF